MAEKPAGSIAVVGSVNVDLSIRVPELPSPGETVLGGDIRRGSGGKGANQAVAAARLGGEVSLIARLGDDEGAMWLRDQLEAEQLDLRGLLATKDVPTGMAVITVDNVGENSIVVASGANHHLAVDDIEAAAPILNAASVVLTQLEIPIEVVAGLRAHCSGRLLLNPAPARAGLDLADFDIVVPNRGELALLASSQETRDLAVVADQARTLDCAVVVVTLGAQGAMIVTNEATGDGPGSQPDVVTVPALPVSAIDTTAAGDSFCGALAVALVEGADIVEAVNWAVRAAGATVTARGAQESLPDRAAVGSWRD